ncbi:16S rRNA (uracil(1498)-N(3))-methyltransferase [Hydrogenimonas sp.]|jgi:16S rRNA (uracil1498-N3)-methyltransferase|uniref:16S rRNA (uracil(1498)-N(3))-methyltransferase n=1 Tax=Hydrogenimonas sp. TaxID=2231112 RepID=UPI00260EE2F9|nr:16S rRNA (uracil(1498)-N(3))-methyltransferase [Hydrogenimonas sp.]
MQFLYHPDAGLPDITIEGEAYRYIFKVRRHREGERIALRNLLNDYLYFYRIDRVGRREAELTFLEKEERVVMPETPLHLGWCVVDPKTVEKTLPALNELGVEKISFVYCDRSQKSFRIDFERLKRILINSSQQCGRSRMMELEIVDSAAGFLKEYPKSAILDFGGRPLPCEREGVSLLVGCEGGFSDAERKLFENRTIYGLDTPLVLRSESAMVAVASRWIL